MNCKQGNMEL